MLPDRLTKIFARVILVTYITQLFAPVVQASERGDVAVVSGMDANITKRMLDRIPQLPLKSRPVPSPLISQPVKISPSLKSKAATSSPSLEPHQQLPTLSVRLDRLPQEAKGNAFRLSIERTNSVDSGDNFTNFQWQKDLFFSSLKDHKASSSPRNHAVHFPMMGSLNLNLSDTGQLTAFSTIDSSGSYQAYNYHFYLSTDLHLANLMTNGQIDVKRARQVSAEGEVYGQEGIFLKGKQEIRTRTKDSQHPTHLHSKKRITFNAPYLDNENSCIQAPLIEGMLGRRGQKGASLDNTKGIIEATDLLSLTLATEVFNERGVLNASSGKTKVSTFNSLLNKKGFVGGKHGLDLTVKGRLQNPAGKLRSEGTTTVNARRWSNSEGAQIWGQELKGKSQMLTTDSTSRLGAEELLDLKTHVLHQESPLIANKIQIQTIQALDLATALARFTLSLSTEEGPIIYKPKGLRAHKLLSLRSKNTPMLLTAPLKSPGAFEATAPEIYNKTMIATKGQMTLKGTATDVPYPVCNEGDLISATKGLTVKGSGFSHTKGHVQVAEDAVFPSQNLRLHDSTHIGGSTRLKLLREQKGDLLLTHNIDFSKTTVEELLHLTLEQDEQKLTVPIAIAGQLEIDREGNSPEPLHLLANLIAKKGLKVCIPEAPLIVGAEEEARPMVKLQAEEGFMDIQSKSLDLIKAQLFSKTGMRWEVQEKEIHIGRSRNLQILQHYTYHIADWRREILCMSVPFIVSFKGAAYRTGYFKSSAGRDFNNKVFFSYSLPFKHSNGTIVVTQGPLAIISPEGVVVNQAELEVIQGDLDATVQAPIINEGGKIFIQGNVHIHGIGKEEEKRAILQNFLQFQTTTIPVLSSSFKHPSSSRGEISIGGNLQVSVLENVSSFCFIGGQFKGTLTEKEFSPRFSTTKYHAYKGVEEFNSTLQEKFPSQVSIAKAAIIPKADNIYLEGVLQSPLIVIGFEGKAMVGRMANYQRQATPPFPQMKMFMDVHRPTALFRPVMNASTPWINQPTVPLSWKVQLPPAVGLGPNGLYLLDPSEKLLLHPLQEVGDLPSVFGAQLKRGYLDEDHPDALATYVMGRHQAYNLYLKFFAPKALEAAAPDHPSTDNPERALRTLDFTLAHTMTEEEMSQLKFMMLYYGMSYEGKTVHLPVSWLSKQYDDPRIRNPDGGVFGKIVVFKGNTPDSVLHCASTIHGENLLGVDVPLTILERQSHQYITYHANTTTKKGSWWRGGSSHTEIVAVHHNTAQPNTGNMTTGKNGQIAVKSKQFELKNGAHMDVGTKGLAVDIDHLIASPAVQAALGYSHSSAGGTSVTQHYPVYNIQPASVSSDGGIKGRIGKMKLDATHMIAFDKDINLNGQEADLLAHRVIQNLGTTVTKEGRAVTVTEKSKEIAMPCVFKAHKGNVLLHFEDRLHGEATQFLAEKKIDLNSKDIDIETLLMKIITRSTSTTQGMFSKQTTDIYQESPEVAQSLFMADEVHFRGQQAKVSGAYIKTSKTFDHTGKGLGMYSTIKQYYSRQETRSSQPLASSKVGMEAGQDVRIPTTLDTEAIIRLPEGHVLLADNTIRRIQQIPGDDNACGFVSLLWNLPGKLPGKLPGFDPLKARQLGVDLLLEHLNDPTFQTQICNLIAPEIKEWTLVDSEELATFPDVDSVIPRIRQAQEDVTKAVRTVNSVLNLKVALTAKKLLAEAKELETDNPDAALIFAPLRQAQEKLEAAKAEIVAWANDPVIVREYVRQIVGQPGWMLGYGSEYDGSPGAMDALALTLGVNLHVYRDKEGEITLVHAHETKPHAPLIELLHTAYRPKESTFANHFDRLEPFNPSADMGKMIFEDTVIDEDVTKIIGNYEKTHIELTNWSRSWAEHHQVIPNEALVVVALAITIATQGTGASLMNGLSGTLFGTVAGTSAPIISLTATGASMASAAFTAVCTQAATSFLSHGDLAQTGKDLLSSQGIHALGTAVATAGLIGDGGSMADSSFGQRLAVNGFRSMVRAGVSSVIEKKDFGSLLKDAGMSAVVDSISGALAKSIGEAAADKGNPLTYGEHKAAHFGVGFLAGSLLYKDHPLTGAVTGGLGAMMGEIVAESLVDRPQIEREVLHEMKQSGEPFSIKAYNVAYREKLQPYINTARLVVGSTIAAMGHNPSIAISAATNALENNFAKSIPLPNWTSFVSVSGGISGFAAYTTVSLSLLYEEVGFEGMFFKLVEDGIIKVQKTNTGGTVYQIHDELFATPEAVWNMIERELPFCQTIKESEWAKGRTLEDTFTSASFTEKLEAVVDLQGATESFQKKSHAHKKSASNASGGAKSSTSGGTPSPDWDPDGNRPNEKKEVIYPNNPKKAPKSFEKIHGGKGARYNKNDKSVWDQDTTSHGGPQWKRWNTKRSWEKKEKPASVWPDGRVRKLGEQ